VRETGYNINSSLLRSISYEKILFLFFYPYTLFAKIEILYSHLPPKPHLLLEKTPTLYLPKIKLLKKEKHSNFLLLYEKYSKM